MMGLRMLLSMWMLKLMMILTMLTLLTMWHLVSSPMVAHWAHSVCPRPGAPPPRAPGSPPPQAPAPLLGQRWRWWLSSSPLDSLPRRSPPARACSPPEREEYFAGWRYNYCHLVTDIWVCPRHGPRCSEFSPGSLTQRCLQMLEADIVPRLWNTCRG